ncbi:MAG: helix-turn-helix domain-containing protein [Planctomycetes bacterium]|nr:helix-turn-helix domain-containing protein [Planctomycetota bacterium]
MQNRQIPHHGAASETRADGAPVRTGASVLGRVKSLTAADYDQFAEIMPSSDNHYLQTDRGRSGGRITQLRLGGLIVVRALQHNRTICEAAGIPDWHYAVVPLRWRNELHWNGRLLRDPSLLACGPGSTYVRTGCDLEVAALMYEPEHFLAAAAVWSGRSPEVWKGHRAELIPLGHGRDDFLARLYRVLGAMERHPEVFESPRVQSLVEQSLTTALLAAAEAAGLHGTKPARSLLSHSRIVQLCREYLNENWPGKVTKLELCQAAGVSARSLQDAFRAIYGLSPSEFLKSRRLHEARRLLRDGDPESTSVKQCALESGFWELGRFSVEYRRHFGESPSETLRARMGRRS